MNFEPVYLSDRTVLTGQGEFQRNKLNLINPSGNSGIVTLWNKPEEVWDQLRKRFPRLFEGDSPLVALSSLYGNGLGQMLANLAHNPQIDRLAVTGRDTKIVPSWEYLSSFLEGRVTPVQIGEDEFLRLGDTSYKLDGQLRPEMFRHLRVERFEPNNLEALVNFLTSPHPQVSGERRKIELVEPKFTDFPSDRYGHRVSAKTPREAWMEVMFLLDRFGANVPLEKGTRRALHGLSVSIEDPSFEPDDELKKLGFESEELREYQRKILSGEVPPGTSYTYGNRLRAHWGGDALGEIANRLKRDKRDRHGLVSLWDTGKDLLRHEAAPCFTDAYFYVDEDKLDLAASFRTHNASSAYLVNAYGLRAIQEHVASEAEIEPGRIHITSRWISIDPEDAGTVAALNLVKQYRRTPLKANDPRGYFVVNAHEGEIRAEHYSSEGDLLHRYTGSNAREVKDQLRRDRAIVDPDHSVWVGYELAKAHHALHGELPDM